MRVPARALFEVVFRFTWVVAASALLVSCATIKSTFSSAADSVSGAFDRVKSSVLPGEDGPPDNAPSDFASIPDAVPRAEPLNSTANRRLAGQGRYYASDVMEGPFSQRGRASWYGKRYQGATTASDEKFDPLAMTAAHPRLPIPSYARVANVRTTKSVIVRINDRGPGDGSVIALSYAAAAKLGIATPDGGDVEVTRIMPDEYARIQAEAESAAATRSTASGAASAAAPVVTTVSPAATASPVTAPGSVAPIAIVPPAVAVAADGRAPVAPVNPVTPATSSAPAPKSAPAASAGTDPGPAQRVPPARPIAGSNARPPKIAAARTAPATGADAAPAPRSVAPAAAAPAAAAAAPSATDATGRWAIQVGVFAVAANAETVRQQVETQLAQRMSDAPAADRMPRVEVRGNRHFVLVGDAADRAAADALAARVRNAVKHDVVIVRR